MAVTESSFNRSRELCLPTSRIRTIMKSSPDVENIGQESLFLITRSTEIFIQYLAQQAYAQSGQKNTVTYKDLAEVVQTNDTLDFLKEIVPRKITAREYFQLMNTEQGDSD